MSLKKIGLAALFLIASALPASAQTKTTLKIGVTPGPHSEILEVVKPLLAKQGIELKELDFSDYNVPNEAVSSGDLDLNSFQHKPFLDKQIADRGYKLANVAKTLVFPMGIYSKKYTSWSEIPDGATIAIQNDPSNGGRALLLLQANGVIKLREGSGLVPSSLDIVENPKNLKFIEVEAAQTQRTLSDVDAASVNTDFIVASGGNPKRDALLLEGPDGPYANILVVREADKDKPWVKAVIEAYQSPEMKKFVEEKYKGAVLTAF
ncbi:MetQ/NlpA family ABC transporter substrate-binding protein [Microvirga sp. W0021]|uniref:MetQ/NlpA family ABC transporter substrate-binding protein n=1 Tax=Hohaiivirga grylli TaxID=3133970 RepID=A0ABV0BGX5_9HYPH